MAALCGGCGVPASGLRRSAPWRRETAPTWSEPSNRAGRGAGSTPAPRRSETRSRQLQECGFLGRRWAAEHSVAMREAAEALDDRAVLLRVFHVAGERRRSETLRERACSSPNPTRPASSAQLHRGLCDTNPRHMLVFDMAILRRVQLEWLHCAVAAGCRRVACDEARHGGAKRRRHGASRRLETAAVQGRRLHRGAQKRDPGCCRNAVSSADDGRPSTALRCGKRPKRSMIVRCCCAYFT